MKQKIRLMAILWPFLRRFTLRIVRLLATPQLTNQHTSPSLKGSRRKTQPSPCFRPSSFTLPSGPIPVCPAYTSVKGAASGTLAKKWRLHSGRKAYMEGAGMGWYQLRTGLETASDISAVLVRWRTALALPGAEQVPMKSRTSPNEVPSEFPSHTEEGSRIKGGKSTIEEIPKNHVFVPMRRLQTRYGLGLALGLVVLIATTAGAMVQQPLHLRGTVVDAATNEPISGAVVTIKDTDIYVRTDEQGAFSLRGAHVPSGTLVVTKSNYEPESVPFGPESRGPFSVKLETKHRQLEEVVVVSTGFYQVPKERATGSFVHVDSALFARSPGSNVLERLDGVTRGLIFNQEQVGGQSFANQPDFSIRGRSTISANPDPLIVLDNFPYEGDIEAINPEDIQSVTILQDAAAASIWGARAGNGVIVLTSKKGRFEQPLRLNVRGDWGASQKPDLYYAPIIPMAEYIELERYLFNEGRWNSRINQVYPYITPVAEAMLAHRNGHIDSMEMERRLAVMKTQDVRRELLDHVYRPTARYKAAISMQGGSKNNSFYLSAGYDRNVGELHDYTDRVSVTARNSFRLLDDKLQINSSVLFSTQAGERYSATEGLYNVPYDRLIDDEGNALSVGGGRDYRQSYIDTAGGGLLHDWNYRPVEELGMFIFGDNRDFHQFNTTVSYAPLDWFSAQASYQYGRSAKNSFRHAHVDSYMVRNSINRFAQIVNGIMESPVPFGGQFSQVNDAASNHHFRGQVDVQKNWGERHALAGIVGMEVSEHATLSQSPGMLMGYKAETETHEPFDFNERYRQYHTGTMSTLSLIGDEIERSTTTLRNLLYFANVAYTFFDRYTVSGSLRKDAANIFGVDINKRGRPFWSGGASWHLHKEGFMQTGGLDKLTLRLTHGYTGNVSNRSAYITSSVEPRAASQTGRHFQRIVNPPNPKLSWENVEMTNAAIDMAAFGGRLSATVEYYWKRATELLSDAPMNPSSGVGNLFGNWSALKGRGLDIEVESVNLAGVTTWRTSFLFSLLHERVTDYKLKPTNDSDYLRRSIGAYPIEGRPQYTIYSLPYGGLDNEGQPLGYMNGEISQDYADIYNNTPLSEFVYHGRATPAVFGGMRNTVSVAGFDLSFNIIYQLGYYFRRNGLSYNSLFNVTNHRTAIYHADYMARWRKAGDETHTDIPVMEYPADNNRDEFYGLSETLVERADHIRLQDVRIAYDLGEKLRRWGMGGQVYLHANNLGLIWKANKAGVDPDAVPNGGMTYPTPMHFSLGFNLNL